MITRKVQNKFVIGTEVVKNKNEVFDHSTWPKASDRQLIDACKKHGSQWEVVARKVGKNVLSCKQRFAVISQRAWKSFEPISWPDDDILRLLQSVHLHQYNTIAHGRDETKEIDWFTVAALMNEKTWEYDANDCERVWLAVQKLPSTRLGAFSPLEDRIIVHHVRKNDGGNAPKFWKNLANFLKRDYRQLNGHWRALGKDFNAEAWDESDEDDAFPTEVFRQNSDVEGDEEEQSCSAKLDGENSDTGDADSDADPAPAPPPAPVPAPPRPETAIAAHIRPPAPALCSLQSSPALKDPPVDALHRHPALPRPPPPPPPLVARPSLPRVPSPPSPAPPAQQQPPPPAAPATPPVRRIAKRPPPPELALEMDVIATTFIQAAATERRATSSAKLPPVATRSVTSRIEPLVSAPPVTTLPVVSSIFTSTSLTTHSISTSNTTHASNYPISTNSLNTTTNYEPCATTINSTATNPTNSPHYGTAPTLPPPRTMPTSHIFFNTNPNTPQSSYTALTTHASTAAHNISATPMTNKPPLHNISQDIFEEWDTSSNASSNTNSVFHFESDENTYTSGTQSHVRSKEQQTSKSDCVVDNIESCACGGCGGVEFGFESEQSFVPLDSEELSDLLEAV